jgi:hypothetical protein
MQSVGTRSRRGLCDVRVRVTSGGVIWWWWVLQWALGSSAVAQQPGVIHTVQKGETLSSVAQQYYGDPGLERVLLEHNGLTASLGASAAPRGLQVIVPHAYYYRARVGDTWAQLAKRFLGDPQRAFLLQYVNRLLTDGKTLRSTKKEPDAGEELLVPFVLRHVATATESLQRISESYFSTREYFRLLQRFNGIRSTRVTRGHVVLVPIWHLKLSPEGKRVVEASVGAPPSDGSTQAFQLQAQAALHTLHRHLDRGEHTEVVALANRLLGASMLTQGQALVVHQQLAVAYVALGREDLAVQSFRRVLQEQPGFALDSVQTSPRVLEAYRKAKAMPSHMQAPSSKTVP